MMHLIDYHQLRKRKYDELVSSLGGRFSWIDRIRMGGTGVGGLTLIPDRNPEILLRFPDTSEPIKFSVEILKKGLLFGFNNTKEVKILPFINPKVSYDLLDNTTSLKGLRNEEIYRLQIDSEEIIFKTDGWNARDVRSYLNKLKSRY